MCEWGEGELGRMYAQDDPPLPLLEKRLGVLAAVLGERHLRTSRCTARRLCAGMCVHRWVCHTVGLWAYGRGDEHVRDRLRGHRGITCLIVEAAQIGHSVELGGPGVELVRLEVWVHLRANEQKTEAKPRCAVLSAEREG